MNLFSVANIRRKSCRVSVPVKIYNSTHQSCSLFLFIGILYIICIGISIGVNVVTSLSNELACEITYPAFEGTPCALLVIVNNLFGLLFFGLLVVPSLANGEAWSLLFKWYFYLHKNFQCLIICVPGTCFKLYFCTCFI